MTPKDFPSLQITLDWTLNELSRAGVDRKSPFRWPVLATNNGAHPEARVIVLRSFARGERRALIYTDRRTPKITQLQQNPSATLVFFDPKRAIQIRVAGVARLIIEGPEHSAAWQKLTENARRDYTTTMAPGAVAVTPGSAPENSSDLPSNFAMIEISVHRIDWLLISGQGHQRAHFEWENDTLTQTWVTP